MAHEQLVIEFKDWKNKCELEMDELRNAINKEKSNSNELKKILNLLKEDNQNILGAL